jgi:aminotransferase
MTEKDFAVGLLKEQKVAVVPGTAFGQNGTGHVRACFATSYEQLLVACDRIERFVNGARQPAA